MQDIQAQIRALQRKQAVIDYYESIRKVLAAGADPAGHEGIAKEVSERLNKAIDDEVAKLLGQGISAPSAPPSLPSFSPDDASRLIALLGQLVRTTGAPASGPAQGPAAPLEPGDVPLPVERKAVVVPDPNDPLRFLLAHKHFDGKTVIFDSPNGPVKGQVCGLDAPNLVVKTETGYTIAVPPIKCKIQ